MLPKPNLLVAFAMVGAFSAIVSPSLAAPVPGFEDAYEAVLSSCAPPLGTPAACEAAINAYSQALVEAGVEPELALQSFTELRVEVAGSGGGDVIDTLFEQLLPESGSVGAPQASPV